jgi:two-component system nitrate/nitrite response regulator NarL
MPMEEPSRPTDSPPIRVLVADKTRMNTQLLAHSLAHDSRFLVIEAESTTGSILALMDSEKPDVVLLSAILEGNPALGFKVVRQLRALHPDRHIVMLLDASERSSVVEAFRAGARGVFCRTESLKTLAKCIQCAQSGQVWANSKELGYLLGALSEAMSMRPPDDSNLSSLSKRERDVVLCVAEGLSNREIAHRLNLTEHTVKNYLFRVFDKLGVSSRVEVVLYAFKLMQSSDASGLGERAAARQVSRAAAKPPRNNRRAK